MLVQQQEADAIFKMLYNKHNIPKDHSHIIGKQYNDWCVLSYSHQSKSGNYFYNCVCICGNISTVSGSNLRYGGSLGCKSCACRRNGKKGLYARNINIAKDNGKKGLYAKNISNDLYFVRCGDYVKIGVSNDVKRRIKDMMTNTPHDFELEYHGVGEGADEEFWHNVFAHRHYRGEWFLFPKTAGGCEL